MSQALREKPKAEQLPKITGAAVIEEGRYLPPPADGGGKTWVRTSALIQRPADSLYSLWRNLELIPQWQEFMADVIETSPTTSHWVMKVGDKTIEWDSEILADEPGKRIAWASIDGDIQNAGEVVFEPAPGGRGTMVTLLQELGQGKFMSAMATLFSRNPKQAVIENLRHFKAYAETGEIPRTQGQPHGPRGASGKLKASTYGENIEVPDGSRSTAI